MQDGGKIQSFASLGLANRRAQQPAKKHKKDKYRKDKHTKDKHKKDKHKKTNTQKTNTKKTQKRHAQKKTYLGLIRLRVPGGEGRGSGKRKKIRIFQLKEQESTTYRACF